MRSLANRILAILMLLAIAGSISAYAQTEGEEGKREEKEEKREEGKKGGEKVEEAKGGEKEGAARIVDEEDPNIIDKGKGVVEMVVEAPMIRDTVVIRDGKPIRQIFSVRAGGLGHSPHTATMYAAVLPGLGQVYNKKYWKLPFLYGGAVALGYCIHFNNKYYKKYSSAYRDFLLKDPNNKSYMEFVQRAHLSEEEVMTTYASWFQNALRNKKDYYRRYRDLSIFGMIGLYALQIVDACVDAHFHTFDVSEDLSVSVVPEMSPMNGGYVGAGLSLRLK